MIWAPPGQDGWRRYDRQPCGRATCTPYACAPDTAPLRQISEHDSTYRPRTLAAANAFLSRNDDEIARHEAAHAIVCLAVGAEVLAVQVAGQPHCSHKAATTAADAIMITIAGDVGLNATPLDRRQPLVYLTKASAGDCDSCLIAKHLRQVAPGADAKTLAAVWLEFHRRALAFFARETVREALDRLTGVLRERGRMSGEDIAEIVDASALRSAIDSNQL
jgi:hypothetical protein